MSASPSSAAGRLKARLQNEFLQRDRPEINKQQPVFQNDISGNTAAVGTEGIDEKGSVLFLLRSEIEPRQGRIYFETHRNIHTAGFQDLNSLLGICQRDKSIHHFVDRGITVSHRFQNSFRTDIIPVTFKA